MLEKVKNKALKHGLINESVYNNITDSEICKLIFRENLSTKEVVSEYSGRGIGLFSIKSEVDKLNGEIHINSTKGKGTEFLFLIPIEETYVDQSK